MALCASLQMCVCVRVCMTPDAAHTHLSRFLNALVDFLLRPLQMSAV